jgi:hypothetical protein
MTITDNSVQAINVVLLDLQKQIDELKKMIQEILENANTNG